MRRIGRWAAVGCGVILAAVWCGGVNARAEEPAAKRPLNVLLIVSDDLSCRLGCYGGEFRTPQIDRLASRGVLFERAYCQFPLCAPSRASFMTGMRPEKVGVLDLATHLRQHAPDCVTLGQLFREHGYFSARVGKIFHYNVPTQIGTNGSGDDEKTWDVRINPAGQDIEHEETILNYTPPKVKPRGRVNLGASLAWRADDGPDTAQTDGKVADETIRLLREHKDKPFFIACGFFRPHVPEVAPRGYFELYPFEQVKLPEEPAEHLRKIPPVAFWSHPPNHGVKNAEDLRRFKRAYLAATSFMDAQLGRVIAAVDEMGLAQNTVIVFISDHGWMLGEHGGQWQKQQLFELSAKVPLIVVAPGVAGGRRCAEPVEMVDLYPTVAELCGLRAPAGQLDGFSLAPLLRDDHAEWDHPAYSEVLRGIKGQAHATAADRHVFGRSVRTRRYRYTEWDEGRMGAELYDYDTDPHEWHNLADDPAHAALRQQMAALLHRGFSSR